MIVVIRPSFVHNRVWKRVLIFVSQDSQIAKQGSYRAKPTRRCVDRGVAVDLSNIIQTMKWHEMGKLYVNAPKRARKSTFIAEISQTTHRERECSRTRVVLIKNARYNFGVLWMGHQG